MSSIATTDIEQRQALLRSTRPWSALSDELVDAVAVAVQPTSHQREQLLVHQGDPSSGLHILASGRVEVRVHTDAGEVVVATLGEGDCFGEMSLLTGDPASADVVAIEDAELLTLDRESFTRLLAANPQALQEFVRILSGRLRATDANMVAATEREKQLAHFIQKERAERYGELISKHPSVRALQAQIAAQAQRDTPLLLQGERGTGKELVARLVHLSSHRKDGPFASVKCAQISETPWGNKLFGAYLHPAPGVTPAPREICYIDLARGGTILLRNIESLPAAIQEHLARFLEEQERAPHTAGHDVRVMATSENSLAELEKSGRICPRLARALVENAVTLPALRTRKRDIPELAKQFASDHARRLKKTIAGLSDLAITKLVSYDYPIANVLELKEAVERAVILTEDETVDAQEIFLGPAPKQNDWGFNLLSAQRSFGKHVLLAIPRLGRPVAAVFFAFILYQCFLGPQTGNIGTLLAWSLWWPALALSFFFAGRMWCSVCPMAFAARAAQRTYNLKWHIPRWVNDYDIFIMAGGFFLIMWIEEATHMRQSPVATGLLLLAIGAGAVTAGILFPRRTWCRHLCPLGGFAGMCSTTAMVELRPTFDICTAKCTGHDCFKGADGMEGCPMFNHVMFVGSNQNCALCMKCVQTCPNGSPQFNLRIPGRELWHGKSVRPETGAFTAMVLGLTLGLAFLYQWEHRPAGPGDLHLFVVTAVFLLAGGVPFFATRLAAWYLAKSADPARATAFWERMLAWIPLALAAFASYQLGFLPGLAGVYTKLEYHAAAGAVIGPWSFSLLSISRVLLMTAGLAVTILVLGNLSRSTHAQEGKTWLRKQAATLAATVAYWAMMLVIMIMPGWLGL